MRYQEAVRFKIKIKIKIMQEYKEIIARLEGLHELILTKFEVNETDHNRIVGRLDTANGRTSKCEDRISILENWRWYIIGILSVVIFIIDFVVSKIK